MSVGDAVLVKARPASGASRVMTQSTVDPLPEGRVTPPEVPAPDASTAPVSAIVHS